MKAVMGCPLRCADNAFDLIKNDQALSCGVRGFELIKVFTHR